MMQRQMFTYRLTELPDPAYPSFLLAAEGDVRAAARGDAEHVSRALADFEPNSASVTIRFLYRPIRGGEDLQQRLAVYVVAQAHRTEAAARLSLLLGSGPLRRFYDLRPIDPVPVDWQQFCAGCDVVRRQGVLEPTITSEFNARALPAYYTIQSLEPRGNNDYLQLDSMLDRVQESVLIDVCVEPTDTSGFLSAHTHYLSLLQRVNRLWESDEDDAFPMDWGGSDSGLRPRSRTAVRPLRVKETLVDDILRRQRRFHETLIRPHLRFHIRVFAKTPATARLLASIVAESAFENGSYQLFDSVRGEAFFEESLQSEQNLRVAPAPALERLLRDRKGRLYSELSGLASVAPVDELTSVFCLPLASYSSPCCIRKNTDPPHENSDDLLVLGYDEQGPDGEPRHEES